MGKIITIIEESVESNEDGCLSKIFGLVVVLAIVGWIVFKVNSCMSERQRAEDDVTETIQRNEAEAKDRIALLSRELEDKRRERAEAEASAEKAREQEEFRRKAEAEAAEKAAAADAESRDKRRELREFALEAAPDAWNAYQTMESDLADIDGVLASMQQSLERAGTDSSTDSAFEKMRRDRMALLRKIRQAESAWRDAYAAHVRWKASPGDETLASAKEAALDKVRAIVKGEP